MKKFFALIMAVLMILSFAACDADNVYGNFVNDIIYENQFAGIGFNLPEDWDFYTDDELNKLYHQSIDAMPDGNEDYVSSVRSFYDMGAHCSGSSDLVLVHLSRSGVPISDADWNETLQAIVTSYEYTGYSDMESEHIKVNISDVEFDAIKSKGKYMGSEFYPAYFLQVIFAREDYAVNVTIGTIGDDKTAELLGNFYIL